MNKAAVAGLSFIIGAGTGVLSTYIYMKRWTDKTIDDAIKDFKENYRGHSLPNDISVNKTSDTDDTNNDTPMKSKSSISDGPVKIKKTQYHKVSAEVYDKTGFLDYGEDELDGKTPEDVFAEAEHPEDADEEDIRLIDIDAYEGDNDIYLKEALIWYTGDDTLVDGSGEVIDDPIKIVGETLDNIDWTGHDVEGDMIYIRNDILQVDYEIECIHGDYKDMIE